MAIFGAYFDDSGTHKDSVVTIVGGFIGSSGRWADFDKKWHRILQSKNVEVFHMSDFVQSRGLFEGWKKQESDGFLKQLIATIKNIRPCIYLVENKEFEEAKSQFNDPRVDVYTPYKLCFDRCLLNLDLWANAAPNRDEIAVIFEDGPHKRNTEIHELYKETMTSNYLKNKHKISRITFLEKKSADGRPLQAADLFNWEVHKYHTERIKKTGRPMRGSLKVLLKNIPKGEGKFLNRDEVKEFFNRVISI